MITWLGLVQHSLWIIGLAILLATISLAHSTASLRKESFLQSLSRPTYRLAIAGGTLAFGLGLMWLAGALWLRVAWMGVLVVSLGEGISAWRDCFGKAKRG